MSRSVEPYDDLIDHLTRTSPLTPGEARRVVADVIAYFSEPTEAYVRRRHAELKSRCGLANEEIFQRIATELPRRRVAPPELSHRQLRRIIYG